MSHEAAKAQIAKLIQTYGCVPVNAPDGPVVERFDPERLSDAIQSELNRATESGWTKITLHMDLLDAALLAKHLRG